jgi:hypothetical protein
MSPTLFLIGAEGPLLFVTASLMDADEKDAFATTARLVCIAHAAARNPASVKSNLKTQSGLRKRLAAFFYKFTNLLTHFRHSNV